MVPLVISATGLVIVDVGKSIPVDDGVAGDGWLVAVEPLEK
jgi:hypothetical protein